MKPRPALARLDSMIEAVAAAPELELHVLSCTQRPMQSPEKLAGNYLVSQPACAQAGLAADFFPGLHPRHAAKVPGNPTDVVQGVGTEREGAISAVFSGFPNVVAIAGNVAELRQLNRPRFGSYLWLTARLENFLLPRTGGVIRNSLYSQKFIQPRAKKNWLIYPGARPFSPAANPWRAAGRARW